MEFWGFKNYRRFELPQRFQPETERPHKIRFGRLPRKKVRPLWWTIIMAILIFILYYYLREI